MANKVQITYYGMEGEGTNLKEARKDASLKIEAALEGRYTPILLTLRGEQILCWRTPTEGWQYAQLSHHPIHDYEPLWGTMCGGGDRDEVEAIARNHLAQITWGLKLSEAEEEEILAFVAKKDRREMKSWIEWQRRYDALRAQGLSDNEAHSKASGL